jgi:hypothetical protein
MTPNPALHPTAKRLRHLVPFSLRSSAAGEGKRYANGEFQSRTVECSGGL